MRPMNGNVLRRGAGVVLLACALGRVAAVGPELKPGDLPRVPPLDPSRAMESFAIKKGFRLDLVAAEPLVVDPIELCFDENGRMFVVEMRDYSEMRHVRPHLGRIRMLEDRDGDGRFERATVYVDDLPWPTAVFPWDGGIFVAASPDILYCKDTDGDGRADVRRVVYTGFGADKGDKLNVQALVNCLRWGLDNRIHGQTAGNGGRVKRADAPDATALDLSGRDFSFDPRTLELTPEAGGGQYGMCFDNRGRKFVCSNSHHIQVFMYEARYAERNPGINLPPALVDIPVDGPAAEVFRTSPEEAWRVIRTRWRVAGLAPGPIEGGGRASGYFTSATGITIYRGDAWPEEFVGDAFTADCGSNLIHRKKVRQDGVALLAERPPDEQKVEFLTSTDLWFRPVQMANAPDGCLYVCDMYREVIEHPWSLPEPIKRLLDLNAGNDRGRIYRIAPEGFRPRPPPRLGRAGTRELVATLEHPNAWHRETAARLLFQRQDKRAVPLLVKLLETSKSPLGRLHALYALDGQGALAITNLLRALADADPAVREHGVRLAEKFLVGGAMPPALWERLCALTNDPDATVRYQLAFTLGEVRGNAKIGPLAALARRDAGSVWTCAAILSSLAEGAGGVFAMLSRDADFRSRPEGSECLRQLAVLVGAQNRTEDIADVLAWAGSAADPAVKFQTLAALGDGLQRARRPLVSLGDFVSAALTEAVTTARTASAPEAARVAAAQLLAHAPYAEAAPVLLELLDQKHPQAVQLAALMALGRFTEAQLGPELARRFGGLTPRLRASALELLLARADRARALLQAIESGEIRPTALDATQVKLLQQHRDRAVRELAARVFAAQTGRARAAVIEQFLPALQLRGDAARGRKIYEERCASCHRAAGEGASLGPDFVTLKTAGREKILSNLIDPNAEVRPEFVGYIVETRDDETLMGLVVNETATSITVRQAYGRETVVPRANILKMTSQGLSLMPEGLEAGLTVQDMADLLAFIEAAAK